MTYDQKVAELIPTYKIIRGQHENGLYYAQHVDLLDHVVEDCRTQEDAIKQLRERHSSSLGT